MRNEQVLKIDLAIKNNILKTYTFTKDVVEIGRIPTADIFIDNNGISREHTRIERSIGGPYIVSDMGSTNGTFLNNENISEATLKNNDVISLGKFSLLITLVGPLAPKHKSEKVALDDFDGTTVLSHTQMERLHASLREEPANKVAEPATPTSPDSPDSIIISPLVFWGGVVIAGIAIGLLVLKLS